MSRYSYLIHIDAYRKFDSPKHKIGNEAYFGMEDPNGGFWKCCIPYEDADRAIADHTRADGIVDSPPCPVPGEIARLQALLGLVRLRGQG